MSPPSPSCPSMFILYVTFVLAQYMFALVSYPTLFLKWQCCLYTYITITIKIFTSHKKKVEKIQIGLTPLTLFVFFCFLKERTPSPLHNEGWTLYSKISEKHIDVLRKNKEEMEGVHDNASAFMHLNMKAHK